MGRASKNFHHSSLKGKPSFTQMPKDNVTSVSIPSNNVNTITKPIPSIPTGRKDLKKI